MFAITSCSTECRRKCRCRYTISGVVSGSSSPIRSASSSAICVAGHAVADQRLVDVDAEQARLGVRDLAQRLPVDAHHLEEGHQREAGGQHRRHVAQRLEVLLVEAVQHPGRQAQRPPDALDQRRLEAGLVGGLLSVIAAPRGGNSSST